MGTAGPRIQVFGCNLETVVVEAMTVDEDGGTTLYPDFPLGSDFTISGVPEGHFFLSVPSQNYWIDTDQRSFMLQGDYLGTPTRTAAQAGTQLAVTGSGMPAWQTTDAAGVFSWNASDLINFSGLLPGQTSFSSSLINFGGQFWNLIDTSKGDDVLLFHQGTTETSSFLRATPWTRSPTQAPW